ncbi:NAD(P)/FAD-dependent oxidoreductase [Sphingomonas crocodyli]|uniref:NADH:ubiquinone reductase (non-electrogenic) n=1 Tax=Sphingomonas crocodyli TaxID=1979270 RepID=A0A437LYK1_9SPHN|nr:NAD(P)/FAD-dependent oxidoreductase [Sphingomonas crocodyli]RVT90508.1 NAD(P)/FAD-dependent oxidoreductase [Sphingomonas crocodyli]
MSQAHQGGDGRRRVVIVGGGFGGLACARALAGADVDVTLIDKRNHHLFQPLLYQVATAALSPADIAVPLRGVLAKAKNVRVLLGEVCGIDPDRRQVSLTDGTTVPYEQLVLATGSAYNYFAHPEWAQQAPAPKSIADARHIRASLLKAFEDAERADDAAHREALLTFVVVGGGPTGVEMAGTIAELARHTLKGNFRNIDPACAKIILVEAGPRILSAFPEELSTYAVDALRRMGVDVRLGCAVEGLDDHGLDTKAGRINARTIIWGAGIKAAQGAAWLGGTHDRNGRIPVADNMAVVGHERIFAIGDVALLEQDGAALPALAQVAQQQGTHLGRELRVLAIPRPFRYRSRGDTAVIGRHSAVYSLGKYQLKGRFAWFLWGLAHVYLLIGFDRRALVMFQWIWRYLTFERGARLID